METTITEYSTTTVALATLSERLKGIIYDVTTTTGMDSAKKDRRELVTIRTSLEAKRKEIKAPALAHCKLIDDEAKRITGELLALEEPIDQQIKAEESRKEAEREAERKRLAEIEAARVAAILQAEREAEAAIVAEERRIEAVKRAAEQAEQDRLLAIERESIAKHQAELAEQKRINDIEAARLKKLADEAAANIAAERAVFEAEKKAAAGAQAEIERIAREKQAAFDAEQKRIADEIAAKQRELECIAAMEAENARVQAVVDARAAEKARKLAESKCADASTAFKKIISIIDGPSLHDAERLETIRFIAEANII